MCQKQMWQYADQFRKRHFTEYKSGVSTRYNRAFNYVEPQLRQQLLYMLFFTPAQ